MHKGRTNEDTWRRWPSASQGEMPQKELNLPTPSWLSILQNCGKINSYGLSHLACGILLWQIKQTYRFNLGIFKLSSNTQMQESSGVHQ